MKSEHEGWEEDVYIKHVFMLMDTVQDWTVIDK